MNIIAFLGSPRNNANSTKMAGIITTALEDKGHKVTNVHLNKLNCRGCQACGACKGKSEVCILKDDLSPYLEEVKNADVIIMATPVYWGDVSAQFKVFMDRTYSYLTPNFKEQEIKHRLPKGKKLVFVQSQGAPKEMFGDLFDRYNSFFTMLDYFDETHVLRGCELNETGAVAMRADLVKEATEIAQKL